MCCCVMLYCLLIPHSPIHLQSAQNNQNQRTSIHSFSDGETHLHLSPAGDPKAEPTHGHSHRHRQHTHSNLHLLHISFFAFYYTLTEPSRTTTHTIFQLQNHSAFIPLSFKTNPRNNTASSKREAFF